MPRASDVATCLFGINRKSSSFTPTFSFVCFSSDFSFQCKVDAVSGEVTYGSAELARLWRIFPASEALTFAIISFLFSGSRLRLNERHTNQLSISHCFLNPFQLRNEKCDVREFLRSAFCTHDGLCLDGGKRQKLLPKLFHPSRNWKFGVAAPNAPFSTMTQ